MGVCDAFNVERYAAEGGRGICTMVFLKGYPLCCRWYINSESRRARTEILVKISVCISCARYDVLYPERAIGYKEDYGCITDRSKYRQCGICIRECCADAREIADRKYNEDELLTETPKDRQYCETPGGDATLGGGESLYYNKITGTVGEQIHRRGYNILVEARGHIPQKVLEDISGRVDYMYHNFKQIDSERRRELTGVGNTLILSNPEWLCDHYSGELPIRYPYIPSCSSDEASVSGSFRYIKSLNHISKIMFLPHHRLGLPKCRGLRRACEMGNMPSLKKTDLSFPVRQAEGFSLETKIQ